MPIPQALNKSNKIGLVMHEFKKGNLNIGKSKKLVKNPKQALAIAMNMSGKSKPSLGKILRKHI